MELSLSTILYALAGGILPAVFWLFFWLREDSKKPEPRGLILRTFILGMCAVVLVLPFQRAADNLFPGNGIMAFLIWAILEEIFKFGAAFYGGLRDIEDNEPIDPMIYMITAALGFVALENTLFIINPLLQQDLVGGILEGNFRFIGASLLHVVSSAAIGAGVAFSFYRSRRIRKRDFTLGFIAAVIIHTLFNLFILNQHGLNTFKTFVALWIGVGVLIFLFERVKKITPNNP